MAKEHKLGTNPLNNRELGLKTRKEIFMHEDLNLYVNEVIEGFKSEGALVSLNEISADLTSTKVSNFASRLYSKGYNQAKTRSGRTMLRDCKGSQDLCNQGLNEIPSLQLTATADSKMALSGYIATPAMNRVASNRSNFNCSTNKCSQSLFFFDYQDPTLARDSFNEEPFGFFF